MGVLQSYHMGCKIHLATFQVKTPLNSTSQLLKEIELATYRN